MQSTQSKSEQLKVDSRTAHFFQYAAPFLLVLAIYFVAVFIAGPSGNFPINDDMIYAYGVKAIVETGSFHVLGGNAFDFIPIQIGALLCSFTGFSYDSLRAVTIAFHVFGAVGLFLSFKELGLKRSDNALFTAIYALNPFMLYLSCTFMTDIPALAFTNWLLYFSICGVKSKSLRHWLLAMVFLTASMAVRQSALSFLPSLLVSALISLSTVRRRCIFASSLLMPVASFFLLQHWFRSGAILTSGYDNFSGNVMEKLIAILSPSTMLISTAKLFCMLGLVALPVVIPICAMALSRVREKTTNFITSLCLSLACVTVPLIYVLVIVHKEFMPFYQNLFSPPYIGTYQFIDAELIWPKKHLLSMGLYASIAATTCAFSVCFSSFSELTKEGLASLNKGVPAILNKIKSADAEMQFYLVTTFFLALGAVLVQLLANGLDRYMCALLAPLLLLFARLWKDLPAGLFSRIFIGIGGLALAVYGTFTLSDSMNCNRAQWQAVGKLEALGINPLRIDAGPMYNYEHGGVTLLKKIEKKSRKWSMELRGGPVRSKLRWWAINNEDYIVSCKPLDEYHVIDQITYWNTIRWRKRPVYLLEADSVPLSQRVEVMPATNKQ